MELACVCVTGLLLTKLFRVFSPPKGFEEDIQSLFAELKSMDAVLLEIEAAASPADLRDNEVKQQYDAAILLTVNIEQCVNKFMTSGLWDAAIRTMIPSSFNLMIGDIIPGSDSSSGIRNFKRAIKKLREWFEDHRVPILAATGRLRHTGGIHVHVKEDLVKKLKSKGQLNIASIHGPPGVGKTTIAAQVYTELEKKFELRAWVTVPTNPDIQEILRSILRQIRPNDPGPIDKKDIIQAIIEALEDKRYFLVIDGICEIRTWAIIKRALTEDCNGSAVLTTTCSADIAGYVGGGHKLETLNDDYSIKLFNQRLFGSEENCPPELKDISREIACTCRGRPLAIIIAAGLLAVKPRKEEDWRSVLDLHAHARIFFDSFTRLSPNTRSCLLYLSLFQKGHKISVDRLIWGWVAEGFVYEQDGMTLQEKGEEYLIELMEERFIEVVEVDAVGKALSCRVHARMHEVLAACSAQQNFATIFDAPQGSSMPQSVNYRLSIQGNKINPLLKEDSLSHVKSLVVSGDGNLIPSLSNFMGLRVFELEGCDSLQDLKGIGSLSRLRCLVMGSTFSSKIQKEIGNLVLLQTLDLRATNLKELPQSVFQIRKLRRLCVNSRTKIPDEIEKMVNLEELGDINISKPELLKKLCNLTKLRVLRIAVWSSDERYGNGLLKYLCSLLKMPKKEKSSPRQAIQSLSILTCCSVHFWDKSNSRHTPINLSLPKLEIRHSKFHSLPRWISSIEKLSSLSIEVYKISEEIIDMLGKLQHLKSLSLTSTSKRFADPVGKFRNSPGAFGKLTSFRIVSNAMGKIFEEQGAMPNLRRFTLSFEASRTIDVSPAFYFGLENLPSSVKHVRVEIMCSSASPCTVEKAEAVIREATKSGNPRVIVEIRRILDEYMDEDNVEQIAKESPDESSTPAVSDTCARPNASKTDEIMDHNVESAIVDDFNTQHLNKAKCSELSVLKADKKMDHNNDRTTVEDFNNRSLDKQKCSESSILDDPLPSPTISTSSMVSECSESICSESINQRNGDPLPSPTMLSVSPVSELMTEAKITADDNKQTVSVADDDKKQDEPKHIKNDVTYDYLPQVDNGSVPSLYSHISWMGRGSRQGSSTEACDDVNYILAPIECKLKYNCPSINQVVAHGTVYPNDEGTTGHSVPLQANMAKVQVNSVETDWQGLLLPIPISKDDVRKLGLSARYFIQWPRSDIVSPSPGPSPPTNPPANPLPNQQASLQSTSLTQQKPTKISPFTLQSTIQNPLVANAAPDVLNRVPRKKKKKHSKPSANSNSSKITTTATSSSKNIKKATITNVPTSSRSSKELSQGSMGNPRGEHWVSVDELEEAGKEAKSVHDLYLQLQHCRDTESNINHIPMKIPEKYHCHDEFGSSMFNIYFENIFHLYNFQMLDMSMMRIYSLLLQKKAERVGIMDPLHSHSLMLRDNPTNLSRLIRDVWVLHQDKQFILMPYNPPGHWVLLIICPASNTVLYLDSIKRTNEAAEQYFAGITGVIDGAFLLLRDSGGGTCSNNGSTQLSHHFNFPAMEQSGNTECGYFVCAHMDEVISNLDWPMSEDSLREHIVSKEASFDYLQKMWTIRETLIRFLVDEVVMPTGEFFGGVPIANPAE